LEPLALHAVQGFHWRCPLSDTSYLLYPVIQSKLVFKRIVTVLFGIRRCLLGMDCRAVPLVSQGTSPHNICGIRLHCGPEILFEYRAE
jgi:hypothetical protein